MSTRYPLSQSPHQSPSSRHLSQSNPNLRSNTSTTTRTRRERSSKDNIRPTNPFRARLAMSSLRSRLRMRRCRRGLQSCRVERGESANYVDVFVCLVGKWLTHQACKTRYPCCHPLPSVAISYSLQNRAMQCNTIQYDTTCTNYYSYI